MSRRDERPVADVPRAVTATVTLALIAQLALHGASAGPSARAEDLPPPPSANGLALASLGDPVTLARLAMLYVQSFDVQPGVLVPYAELDYGRLTGWLEAILRLDPLSDYPLFAASRLYSEVSDPDRLRAVLNFVHEAFLKDPDRRWKAMAFATLTAKHRLGDMPLALKYAEAIRTRVTGEGVPDWARQMSVFILEDMDELEAARVLLGGMLAEGAVTDPSEARYLRGYLERLEEKAGH
ncbi:MAG: hypothetical protein ACOZDY_14565 [Pseudomonadota bacterium]